MIDLPAAGIAVSPWLPVLAGFLVGLVSAPAGISGAIYLLPFQLSVLGVDATCASGTNMLYNLLATPGGILRYIRERRMCWPLSLTVVSGTVPGILLGVYLRMRFLVGAGVFRLFVGWFLVVCGLLLLLRTVLAWQHHLRDGRVAVEEIYFDLRWIRWRFASRETQVNVIVLFGASLLVGIASGAYGIGGAGLLIPLFVLLFRIPVYVAAASSLFANFVNSGIGVAAYSWLGTASRSGRPDPLLAFLLAAGGFPGIYLGARLQKHLPASAIRLLMAAIALAIGARYVLRSG